MILYCHEMLNNNDKIKKTWQNYFSHIMVDEFQDINRLQYQVLKKIAAPRNNLFIVGDDDQSIYGFRGANPAVMKDFLNDFPKCEQVVLETNYRSTRQVVAAAAKVIILNENRMPKDYQALRDGSVPVLLSFAGKESEDEWVLQTIREMPQEALKDAAVILRTNFEVSLLAGKCTGMGIPVKVTEKVRDIFSHFTANDLIDYLYFSAVCKERCRFLNIINKPLRYISRKCVANLTGEVNEAFVLSYYQDNPDGQGEVRRFFADCRRIAALSPYLAINFIRKGIGYDRYLKDRAKPQEFNEWVEICNELQESARGYATHEEWFDLIAGFKKLASEKADSGSNCNGKHQQPANGTGSTETDCLQGEKKNKTAISDGLNIITMHSSKGLEFDTVFLPHLNEGTLPGAKSLTDEQIEEERRLFYVAMTRAKEKLFLTYSESAKYAPSRFLTPLKEFHPGISILARNHGQNKAN
jgi:DNA helicase-2/ATP-dependent DNA helicase PcrA